MRSRHSFFSTYLLRLILSIIPSLLVFKIGLVLMVFRLIGSHLISHLALRQSQSMIPSLHSLLSPVVYPKVPYLAHSFLLSILLPFNQSINQSINIVYCVDHKTNQITFSSKIMAWLGDLKKFPQIPFVR